MSFFSCIVSFLLLTQRMNTFYVVQPNVEVIVK
jgi:hypothetical protein